MERSEWTWRSCGGIVVFACLVKCFEGSRQIPAFLNERMGEESNDMTLGAPTCFSEVKDKVGSLRFCFAAQCDKIILKRISWQVNLATNVLSTTYICFVPCFIMLLDAHFSFSHPFLTISWYVSIISPAVC